MHASEAVDATAAEHRCGSQVSSIWPINFNASMGGDFVGYVVPNGTRHRKNLPNDSQERRAATHLDRAVMPCTMNFGNNVATFNRSR
jgi:hypothetical protein